MFESECWALPSWTCLAKLKRCRLLNQDSPVLSLPSRKRLAPRRALARSDSRLLMSPSPLSASPSSPTISLWQCSSQLLFLTRFHSPRALDRQFANLTAMARALSTFEALPTELQSNIFSYLIGTNAPSGIQHHREHPNIPALHFTNKHQFQLAILHASKTLYAVSKAVLYSTSKWIIIDMDYIDVLLSWGCMDIPFTVLHTQAVKLPQAIMHIRFELPLGRNDRSANPRFTPEPWPASRPHRQNILLAAHDLPAFVRKLRVVDIIHGIHIHTPNVQGPALIVRVHVSPSYPQHLMRILLATFAIFHGPYNFLAITGLEDTAFTLAIETSIRTPRTTPIFNESLILSLQLIRQSYSLPWHAARPHHRTIIALYHGSRGSSFTHRLTMRAPTRSHVSHISARK